jgi:hypothetical protein
MLTVLVLLFLSVTILVVLLLVIVAVGFRQEPPAEELSEQASSLIAAFVRRLIGLHVRKPGLPPPGLTRATKGGASRAIPLADPMSKPNVNEHWRTLFDARARHAIRIESRR